MKVRSEELSALKVLKKHFYQYQGLEILEEDKPDLKDLKNSIGVEVVRAINEDVEQKYSFMVKSSKNNKVNSISNKSLEHAKNLGVDFVLDGEKSIGFIRILDEKEKELLHNSIEKKYEKKYKGLKTIDLYIFFRQYFLECLSDNDIQLLFQTIENCEKKYGKVFTKIIIDFHSKLLVLDTIHKTYEKIEVDNSSEQE